MIGTIKILASIMVIMGIIIVPFQFLIVQTLKKNGFDASMFMFLPSDLKKYKHLIDTEKNESDKRQMLINFYAVIIGVLLAISCFVSVILIVILSN
jgi:hypothetical protein